MVFFTDEEFESFSEELSETHPLYMICQNITQRFDKQKKFDSLLLDDLRSQESADFKVVFCSSVDFPSSKTEGGKDHTLLETWNINPVINTWSTDDSQKILWNTYALDNIYKQLPSKNLCICEPGTCYGVSSISTSQVPTSCSVLSVTVFHPDWNQGYEIRVSYATLLDSICTGTPGKIIFEIEDSSSRVSCGHNGPTNECENSFLHIRQQPRNRSNSRPIPITSTKDNTNPCKSDSIIGSPRYPAFNRRRSKTTNSTRNLSISPGTDLIGAFAGSLQESLLSGHMSTRSTVFSGFSAKLTASSPHTRTAPVHLRIPFDTHYYHLEDYNKTPYAASIVLPKDRFRIAHQGLLQVTLSNPTGTPVKVFVVRYDLSSMPANSKTFLRQITRTSSPPHILQYAIQFTIICTKHKRLYIYKNIRVVFPHRIPDEEEKLEVICQSPDSPQFFQV